SAWTNWRSNWTDTDRQLTCGDHVPRAISHADSGPRGMVAALCGGQVVEVSSAARSTTSSGAVVSGQACSTPVTNLRAAATLAGRPGRVVKATVTEPPPHETDHSRGGCAGTGRLPTGLRRAGCRGWPARSPWWTRPRACWP